MDIQLGFVHKGIEHLSKTRYSLEDGWKTGGGGFGRYLLLRIGTAYCQAVEALAGVDVSEDASLMRAIFLELERIDNHIGDCAALAQGCLPYDVPAAELAYCGNA